MFKRRPGELRKWFLGAPKYLFQARLGFLFGKRFICIVHEGRNTGKTYLTPLEVVYRAKETGEYFVISARGARADWYRNIQKYPVSAVYIGSRKRRMRQRMVPVDEAIVVIKDYQRRHPKAAAALAQLIGSSVDNTDWSAAMEQLPMVAFGQR